MDVEMAYLVGMVLGNGEIQQDNMFTNVTIDIPYKNLRTDDHRDVAIYVSASIEDIREIIQPLTGQMLTVIRDQHSTMLSFRMPSEDYIIREILRLIGNGRHHSTMRMNTELFSMNTDEKKALLRGFADVTGYIRKANNAYGNPMESRVYIEIPRNWYMVIDVANMLKSIDIPVQTIDFGHPNFRDANLKKYNSGNPNFWKKEHQIKIYANEFLPIGFNIKHKQDSLIEFAENMLDSDVTTKTHRFYWEKITRRKEKPIHPGESDSSIPERIRGMHFNSWTDLANILGYGE